MPKRGIEGSVTSIFEYELRKACREHGVDDLSLSLNSGDRKANADSMFSACDRFFIIEMKSRIANIGDEARKDSALNLCTGLIQSPRIRTYHRKCHYIMWGVESPPQNHVTTRYSIYEDSVCRSSLFPGFNSPFTPEVIPVEAGRSLAQKVVTGQAGLRKPDFFHYLHWLLGDRALTNPAYSPTQELPITLIGNSERRELFGYAFSNFAALDSWAEQALLNRLSNGGS